MMLGNMRLAHGLYGSNEPTLAPDKRELGDALAQAVDRLPPNIYKEEAKRESQTVAQQQVVPAPNYIKPNAYCVHEDGRHVHQ